MKLVEPEALIDSVTVKSGELKDDFYGFLCSLGVGKDRRSSCCGKSGSGGKTRRRNSSLRLSHDFRKELWEEQRAKLKVRSLYSVDLPFFSFKAGFNCNVSD